MENFAFGPDGRMVVLWDPFGVPIFSCIDPGNGKGGGIYCSGGAAAVEIRNCLIAKNIVSGGMRECGSVFAAGYGGGLFCESGAVVSILNSSICENMAYSDMPTLGVGIFRETSSGSCTVENSIIWGNTNNYYGSQIYGDITLSFCDVQSDAPIGGESNFSSDPQFVQGPLGGYYLSSVEAGQSVNSPCINRGNNVSSAFGLDTFTTSTDNYPDVGGVDLGYHYAISAQPEVWLDWPNGGETLIAGKPYSLQWHSQGGVRNVKIEYSINNGASWQEVYPANYGNSGTYQWLPPAIDSDQCQLRLVDRNFSSAADSTQGTFTIFRCLLKADLDGNCHVNLMDIAILANEWLVCGNPFDSSWCTEM